MCVLRAGSLFLALTTVSPNKFCIRVLACGKCSYAGEWSLDGGKHGQGGGVRHLLERYTEVQPLVFGHYGEINKTFSTLIERLGRAIAERHHRPFGWKNANAGISRARAGVMRRISMAILRATAQHLLSGLDIIGPHSIYAVSYTHLTLPTILRV